MIRYKKNTELMVEVVCYSFKDRYIQVRVNGLLTQYTIQGNIEHLYKLVCRNVKLGLHSEALRLLRKHKEPRSKVYIDIYDALSPDADADE